MGPPDAASKPASVACCLRAPTRQTTPGGRRRPGVDHKEQQRHNNNSQGAGADKSWEYLLAELSKRDDAVETLQVGRPSAARPH